MEVTGDPKKVTWKELESNKIATDNSFEKFDYRGRQLCTVFSQSLGSELLPSSSPPSSPSNLLPPDLCRLHSRSSCKVSKKQKPPLTLHLSAAGLLVTSLYDKISLKSWRFEESNFKEDDKLSLSGQLHMYQLRTLCEAMDSGRASWVPKIQLCSPQPSGWCCDQGTVKHCYQQWVRPVGPREPKGTRMMKPLCRGQER